MQPKRVVFDQSLPLSVGGQMLRGILLVVCLRGLTRAFFCCVAGESPEKRIKRRENIEAKKERKGRDKEEGNGGGKEGLR